VKRVLLDAVRFLRANDDILLIAHVSPDGDTLGSSFALFGALQDLGKRVQVVCEDPVPAIYRFLPFSDQLLLPAQARPLFRAAKATLNIDHHGTNDRYADENFVQKAGATGELIFNVLASLKVTLNKSIASCLYAAITTDTGNFSYSNTTPDTLRIAAELLDVGIDLPYLNQKLFRTVPFHKLRLHALAVTKAQLYEYGRIGISMLTLEEISSCGASAEDTEGIIDNIRDIDTVEVAALLRESDDGQVRVSLRGKSCADVSKIATKFGGGGHKLAAGCTMKPPLEDAAAQILESAKELLHGECG